MRLLLGSQEHTSELQSPCNLVCRLLLEKKKTQPLPAPASIHRPSASLWATMAASAGVHIVPPAPHLMAASASIDSFFFFFFFLMTLPPPALPLFPLTTPPG